MMVDLIEERKKLDAVAPKEGVFSGTTGAAIQGAAGLIGGLFSLGAEKKRRELEALQAGQAQRRQAEAASAQTIGNQSPFQGLMGSYNFLGKRGM